MGRSFTFTPIHEPFRHFDPDHWVASFVSSPLATDVTMTRFAISGSYGSSLQGLLTDTRRQSPVEGRHA